MFAVLFIVVAACCGALVIGAATTVAVWAAMLFVLLDRLVQEVPRGIWLFLRLAYSLAKGLFLAVWYLWCVARPKVRRGALIVYVWAFVWCYHVREWYIANELKTRKK